MRDWVPLHIVALVLIGRGAAFQFSCPSSVTSDNPPISNRTTYAFQADISIEGENTTIEAYEFFDQDNGTIFLYVHFPDKSNTSVWINEKIVHDYNHNQTFIINEDTQACTVTDLNRNETYSIFGMGIENGFSNPQYAFRWNGNYNYTKSNLTMEVRGISAEMYSTCITFNDSKVMYEVDLLFSTEDWNMRAGGNVPLQLVLRVNQTEDDGKSFKTERYTYSFTQYHHDASLGWTPSLPHDIICPGRKDVMDFPSFNSTDYGWSQEIMNGQKKVVQYSRVFYDYSAKLFRYDFHPSVGNVTAHTIIHDFHSGVEYRIDKEIGNCVARQISNDSLWDYYDVEEDPNNLGHFHMINTLDKLKAENFTYTGRSTHRHGITVDSFTSAILKSPTGTYRKTYYYTTPEWNNGVVSPVPVGLFLKFNNTVNGTLQQGEMELRIFDVVLKKHPYTFDVGTCYTNGSRATYVLKFAKQYSSYLAMYSTVFAEAVRNSVAKAANVSMVRVSPIVETELGTDASSDDAKVGENLFVSVTLYDKPKIAGNTSELMPQINLTTAVANLQKVVQDNMLHVKIQTKEGEVSMTAFSDYFKGRPSLYSPPSNEPVPAQNSLSNGAVAALCIGMGVIGFIVGAVFCHFRYKRGNRQFGYGIQD